MTIKRIETGKRMSQAVVHNGTVYTAGQVAQNAKGGSVTEQTQDILAKIDQLLAEAGTDKSKLLTANIWLTDIRDFAEMNAVYGRFVATPPPARSTVQVSRLPRDARVEIDVIAVVP